MNKKNLIITILVLTGLVFSSQVFSQTEKLGANALYNQGIQHYEKGFRRLAADSFRKCLDVDPAHAGAKKYLGFIGQAYIYDEVQSSLERYEVRQDARASRQALSQQQNYQNISRNLDYTTASAPPVIRSVPVVSEAQVSQVAAAQAKEDFASRYDIRQEAVDAARRDYDIEKQSQEHEKRRQKDRGRNERINEALEDARLKMSADYTFVRGEQSFRVINSDGSRLSKLTYPIKGGMTTFNMEYKITPKIFAGGRWMSSNFRNTTSKDEDWNIPFPAPFGSVNYNITEQDNKNNAKYFDANIYYRMFDWDKEHLDNYVAELLLVDRMYLDVFGGYQYYKATHTMQSPTTRWNWQDQAGGWWTTVPTITSSGLDSKYEIEYKGPRIGLRLGGNITEKVSSSLSFSYAWLSTQATGNWNLRNFNWWHKGDGLGTALTTDIEAEYHITPNWFAGAGFHYMFQEQKDLLYSGVQPGSTFSDLDQAREATMHMYGPSLKVGMRW
jgi:Protochlamydia outer membrane protein